jgi:hypothetical protein
MRSIIAFSTSSEMMPPWVLPCVLTRYFMSWSQTAVSMYMVVRFFMHLSLLEKKLTL